MLDDYLPLVSASSIIYGTIDFNGDVSWAGFCHSIVELFILYFYIFSFVQFFFVDLGSVGGRFLNDCLYTQDCTPKTFFH